MIQFVTLPNGPLYHPSYHRISLNSMEKWERTQTITSWLFTFGAHPTPWWMNLFVYAFLQTLTGSTTKWYIELPWGFFTDFNTVTMDFLTHYQLPICYETRTKILSSFKQTKATHISDHIHEWQRRWRLIKLELPDQLLAEWFMKSFMNDIAHDIAMGGFVTEG